MDQDALVASFMQVTATSDAAAAAQHLDSCAWRLDEAVDLYYADAGYRAGLSAVREAVREAAAARAPIVARSDTLYGVPYDAAVAGSQTRRSRPSRWSSEVGTSSSSDSDSGSGGGDAGADDAGAVAEPPAVKKRKKTLAELYRAPDGLTYKGGFHDAKAHAARLSRWLLVNVQAGGEFPSHVQNRDVWASEMVAEAVRDNFVLWQADVDDDNGGEANKVFCYYKLTRDKLPAVFFVDPLTGQLMGRLNYATDPSDFLMAADKFTGSTPATPIRANRASTSSGKQPAPGRTKQRKDCQKGPLPAKTEEEKCHQEQPAPGVAAAASAPGEKVCKLRVRLPDGQVVSKEFGSQCGVAALFSYCRSAVGGEQPFRVMRMGSAGGGREEVREDNDLSFEHLGLHLSTVSVLLN